MAKNSDDRVAEQEYFFPTLGVVVRAASLEEAEKLAREQVNQLEIIKEAEEAEKE